MCACDQRAAQRAVGRHHPRDVEEVGVRRDGHGDGNDAKRHRDLAPVPTTHPFHHAVVVGHDPFPERAEIPAVPVRGLHPLQEQRTSRVVAREVANLVRQLIHRHDKVLGPAAHLLDQGVRKHAALDGRGRVPQHVPAPRQRGQKRVAKDPFADGRPRPCGSSRIRRRRRERTQEAGQTLQQVMAAAAEDLGDELLDRRADEAQEDEDQAHRDARLNPGHGSMGLSFRCSVLGPRLRGLPDGKGCPGTPARRNPKDALTGTRRGGLPHACPWGGSASILRARGEVPHPAFHGLMGRSCGGSARREPRPGPGPTRRPPHQPRRMGP